ncbi:GGDEF domain-containing protein [Haliea sp. E1-2-M8]|uniref:tetratricopeptide repeat-containing diguanylate cyclase n=1 Tax=Haliea sp. E1-2-M8 TaxID=3064706 RepID=UPI0027254A90|nr:GGDEF domain-containing protein [Haliea sp. E1-2-M8]MDO8861053.1 GGDEF domain-containing protein [Haliea sp. E1-2-M8]
MKQILCLLLLLLTSAGISAQPEPPATAGGLRDRLSALEDAGWRDPWRTWAELQTLEPELDAAGSEARLHFYLVSALTLQWQYQQAPFRRSIEEGLALVTEQTPAERRLLLATLQGVSLRRDALYEEAIAVLEQTAAEASAQGQDFAYVLSKTELAFTQSLNGHHDTALLQLQSAFRTGSEMRDPFSVAVVNETFGAVYGYIGEYAESLKHYQRALETYSALGYRGYEAEAINGLGITWRYSEEWDKAIASFKRYRELTERQGSDHNTFVAFYGLGMTYAEQGACESALTAIDKALSVAGIQDFRAELLKRQAVCLAQAGEAQAALAAIASARAIFNAIPELTGTSWHLDVDRAEALVHFHLNEHERAFSKLLAFHEDFTELQARSASERVMRMRVDLEDERKNTEIRLLREQARADHLEIQQREQDILYQRITIAFAAGIALLILLFLVLQRRNTLRFRELSQRDALTGLFNRRYIFAMLDEITAGLPHDRGLLAVIVLDLDDFKDVNDRYGHPVGDRLLRAIAEIGSETLRAGDAMARVGGEEFLCVLPRTSTEQAAGVAQRLAQRIGEHHVTLDDGREVGVTASVGIAGFSAQCRDANSIYACADRALYESKTSGKNRVTLALPEGGFVAPSGAALVY